jgi:hypothetical protein
MITIGALGLMALGCYRVTEPNQGYSGRHEMTGQYRQSPAAGGRRTGTHRMIGA